MAMNTDVLNARDRWVNDGGRLAGDRRWTLSTVVATSADASVTP
jgi:hypothetical protein